MNKDYLVHWLLGVLCSAIWFWGDRMGIPSAAVTLASSVVPGILAHALAYVPDAVVPDAPVLPAAPAAVVTDKPAA
jgi:hypothetical protein